MVFFIKVNDILTAGLCATAFAFLLYFIIYNRESRVARMFSALLACVFIVYLMDLLLTNVRDLGRSIATAALLLRLQWLGIAFTPVLYLEFARAIRLSVLEDHYPDWFRPLGLTLSVIVVILAWWTDWVVYDGEFTAGAPHMRPGPLFYPFAGLFVLSIIEGLREIWAARSRCYTRAARRRMTYLLAGFVAPALGVFPYLLFIGWPSQLPDIFLWVFLLLSNIVIAVLLLLVAYGTAFIGVLTPERVVKHRFVRFLLRGPVAALLALVAFHAGSGLERALFGPDNLNGGIHFPFRALHLGLDSASGLGPSTFSLVATAIAVILVQLSVELAKPLIDLALYRESREEVAQIQALSERLLTVADLRQFLENILAAACELLRSSGGFIAILENGQPRREIWYGHHISMEKVATLPLQALEGSSTPAPASLEESVTVSGRMQFTRWEDYQILPIHDKAGERILGVVGFWLPLKAPGADGEAISPQAQRHRSAVSGVPSETMNSLTLQEEQWLMLDRMLQQASAALEDRQLQKAFFKAFAPLLPELEAIQHRLGMLRYDESATRGFSIVESPQLPKWIHKALSHYWGGPRLTESPLLRLVVVQQAAEAHEGNQVKGLRAVLNEAIERLRPEGERILTAPEWLLYNILEMKFLRGQKVREVARRLALSESDLYRKQRVAIENLSHILVDMEEDAQVNASLHDNRRT